MRLHFFSVAILLMNIVSIEALAACSFNCKPDPEKFQIVDLDLPNYVEETYISNLGDMNNDGNEEFLVSFMISPRFFGSDVYSTSKDKAETLPQIPSFLFYSDIQGKYKYAITPLETHSSRMWAVKSFEIEGQWYILLGRNGEVGMPNELPGEQTVILSASVQHDGVVFGKPIFEPRKTVTSTVDVFTSHGSTHPVVINYNRFKRFYGDQKKNLKTPYRVFDSIIFEFDAPSKLVFGGITPMLKGDIAHNRLRIVDLNDDGQLDYLAAAEVWKKQTGSPDLISRHPGSYVVLDFLATQNSAGDIKHAIQLKPFYGKDHAGTDLVAVKVNDQIFLVESASRFHGHQSQPQFSDAAISFYKYADRKAIYLHSHEFEFDRSMQGEILSHDIDGDLTDDVLFSLQGRKRKYFKYQNGKWNVTDLDKPIPEHLELAEIEVLKTGNTDCLRWVSSEGYFWRKPRKKIDIYISQCDE